jgi:uncharacterized C2H2 Zn-finger protein
MMRLKVIEARVTQDGGALTRCQPTVLEEIKRDKAARKYIRHVHI